MIDSKLYAFGLDTEQFSSNREGTKMMDWKAAALYNNGEITFVFVRIGQSWAFMDSRFYYNWAGVREMDKHRRDAGIFKIEVGRGGYHVIYPSQDPIRQYDNIMTIMDGVTDWDHDRLSIDLELHQNQSRRTITDCTKKLAYKLYNVTGRYPLLYCRTAWLNTHAYPEELSFMETWLAQYRWPLDPPAYTEEYPPPPSALPKGHKTWKIHQTGDHCKPIGSKVKTYMDYNRFNGGPSAVAKYFGYTYNQYIPIVVGPSASVEDRLAKLEERVTILENKEG